MSVKLLKGGGVVESEPRFARQIIKKKIKRFYKKVIIKNVHYFHCKIGV